VTGSSVKSVASPPCSIRRTYEAGEVTLYPGIWSASHELSTAWTSLIQTDDLRRSHPAGSLAHLAEGGAAGVPRLSAYRLLEIANRRNSFRSPQASCTLCSSSRGVDLESCERRISDEQADSKLATTRMATRNLAAGMGVLVRTPPVLWAASASNTGPSPRRPPAPTRRRQVHSGVRSRQARS
jgi:hypothetical protein